ncbi:ABC transporter permease [Clostridium tagluense]|uniref:FtsX-like permease family protein n=1 Tax=Clostridium tagluense TaxID=360422 RepID=UPI001CF427F3|nr:ABC transporter permease [Clostridium tagluense]MCB2311854.1 ABC transporter permease [Clostridium tagluense]MCB2317391.1 ABC transporter permease [Clostridium tagluense]MCB2323742.1 ABC transporter permease [Clostridium tagluense]MCB2326945.1 ABC transporter permease [Clostridium tagluense]MCB2333454.1 ABC transporter permease [Clostridium tagluense]
MTFSRIAFKMFKADVKKYRLFILCNLSSIAILHSFISISVNQQFMNASIVDPMISSNIYAPTFLVLLFTGIFIPYSQSVFIKARQKDYGILLTLGMSENEVRNSVLIENLILCVVSLIIGLVSGTVLSLFFLGFIHNVIGFNSVNIAISLSSYKITTMYVLGIFLISLIVNVYGMIKSTVYDKIKCAEKAESGNHYSIIFSCVGIVFTIVAFVVMILFYHANSNIWFLSLFFCILGSVLIFFNGEALIESFQSKHYKRYIKNIFLFSDIKYYYSKNKKIFFVTTWIFFAISFFIAFSLVTYPNFTNNAIAYHPFHIVYSEIKDNFKPLSDNEIKAIVQKNGNSITTSDTVEFVRNNAFTVFCVDDVNKIMNKNYNVKSNSFVYVYPYDINDGYEHNVNLNISSIGIDSHEGTKKFIMQNTIINPLFGKINCISDSIILVNKKDYNWIKVNGIDYYIKGTLHLYNFGNWRNSNGIANEVWNNLMKKNNIEKEDARFYKISSRIEAYNTALKSSDFLIFFVIYASLLLYFSAIIMIHFKLEMEYKDDKRKYFSLYRIGIREIELKKMISQKILMIYFIPFVYAMIINIAYSYYANSSYGYGVIGILYAIITSLIFLIIHFIMYKLYFISYYKRVISELS